MDAGALGGLCCGSRDQVLASDRWVSQAGSEQSDWEREDQAIPGTDLGEGVLTHGALQNFIKRWRSSSGPGRVRFFIGRSPYRSTGLGG